MKFKMKKSIDKFNRLFSKNNEIKCEISMHGLEHKDYEVFINLMSSLSELQGDLLSLRKCYLNELCSKFPKDFWVWYYASGFFKYEINSPKRAYDFASKSLNLMREKNEYVGAISRNFIALAFDFQDFTLIDNEILRLNNNPNKDSQILYGVAEDLSDFMTQGKLSQASLKILKKYIVK